MKVYRYAAVSGVLGVCLLMMRAGEAMDDAIGKGIAQVLNEYRLKNKVSWEDIDNSLFDSTVNRTCLAKGHIGPIRENVWINLSGSRNSLTIGGKLWEGKLSKFSEFVLIQGTKVVTTTDDFKKDYLTVIIFTPTQVKFIDYSSKQAGDYNR